LNWSVSPLIVVTIAAATCWYFFPPAMVSVESQLALESRMISTFGRCPDTVGLIVKMSMSSACAGVGYGRLSSAAT
jgi:hypothetical protein